MSDTIEERRRMPLDNDVLTLLIQAEEQGDRPSEDELMALVAAVLGGGTETTVHLMARIRKGQRGMAMLSNALRDEAVYPRASAFDLRRGADAGIAFGGSAHYCIGASLARLEGRIAIDTLLNRFPEMELAGAAIFASHPSLRKMTSLPVRLRASAG
ncbi:cytochrome P450 [Sorangium sp. So ce269]